MTNFVEKLESTRIGSLSLMSILSALIVFIVFLIVRKVVNRTFVKAINKSRLDASLKSFLASSVNVLLWLLIVMIMADKLGIPMTSIVALFSVAGLALSLSLQGLLENLFSGMTILATKPFSVGDFVDIDDTTGTVTAVGFFYTVLKTVDGKEVRFPNSSITSAKVTNYSRYPARRVDLEISVSYDDDTEKVKAALLDTVKQVEGVLMEPEPLVGILEYGSSSIKYALYVWVNADSFISAKFAITETVRQVFASRGITMTYNHLNVHIEKE